MRSIVAEKPFDGRPPEGYPSVLRNQEVHEPPERDFIGLK